MGIPPSTFVIRIHPSWHYFHSHAEALAARSATAQRLALRTPRRHSRLSSPDINPYLQNLHQADDPCDRATLREGKAVCSRMLRLDRLHSVVELCDRTGIAFVDARLQIMRGRYVNKASDVNSQHVLEVFRIPPPFPTKTSKRKHKDSPCVLSRGAEDLTPQHPTDL